MLRILALPLAFVLSAVIAGQASAQNRARAEGRGILLSTTCNASSLATSSIYVETFSNLTLSWALTDANSSVAAVTATCVGTGDQDAGATTTYKIPIVTSVSGTGTATYVQYTYSFAPSGTNSSQFTIPVTGNRHAVCTFACGGAGADSITVRGTVTTP